MILQNLILATFGICSWTFHVSTATSTPRKIYECFGDIDYSSYFHELRVEDIHGELLRNSLQIVDGGEKHGTALYSQSCLHFEDRIKIETLSYCVQESMVENFEKRDFGGHGGNNVTYLSGFFQRFLPSIWEKILKLINTSLIESEWRAEGIYGLNARCVEHLSYSASGYLGAHKDADSAFTAVFMLSELHEYTGGDILIATSPTAVDLLQEDSYRRLKLEPLSMIIFDSERVHAVDELVDGTRCVLVVEFWPFPESDVGDKRPSLGAQM